MQAKGDIRSSSYLDSVLRVILSIELVQIIGQVKDSMTEQVYQLKRTCAGFDGHAGGLGSDDDNRAYP